MIYDDDLDSLINEGKSIGREIDSTLEKVLTQKKELIRVVDVISNTKNILDDLDIQFCKKTGLTPLDIGFLFLATGMQILRQYLVRDKLPRISASDGDKLMEKIVPPSWQDILLRSVPYDIIKTGSHVSETGLSGITHRYRTLGHDPILGWVFGTANIMTNSLTKSDFETYQVNMNTKQIVRHYPLGVCGMMNNAIQYGAKNQKLLVASVARQAIHFGSDYFTEQGLPVPFIATVNNDIAKDMILKYHLDMYNISTNATLATFINAIISIIHGLFYNGNSDMDKKLYEVRTRRIIDYSNLIASSQNLVGVAVSKQFDKLDLGGLAVTIYRLITDAKFIREVKEEFIFGSYRSMIKGE